MSLDIAIHSAPILTTPHKPFGRSCRIFFGTCHSFGIFHDAKSLPKMLGISPAIRLLPIE